jgi:HK97 family phage major capsid protein
LGGGVGSEGGFLLPEQFSENIIDSSIEEAIVLPRAMVYGLKAGKGRTMKIPAFEDLNHSSAGVSGVTAQWTEEAGEKTKTDPKFRAISMKVHKLVCYTKSSDELVQESGIPLNDVIGGAFKKSVVFYSDYAYLQGTGAGQPLGVLNSPALITQAKESGQTASTINYDNVVNIFSQLSPGSFKNAVWVASISTLPQLMKLSIEVGLGGNHVRVLQEDNGKFYLLGKEVLFTEKVPALGSAGCLGLYDFGAYGILLKEGIRLESSIHEGFRDDQTSWRMVLNTDGQPTLSNTLTCLDGVTVVSPFVTLGAV